MGVIGAGYWGPNLIRNFDLLPNARVTAVADTKSGRRDFIAARHPHCRLYDNAGAMIADDNVEAVVIATPVSSHFPLAQEALAAGKHVLLEKPMCASTMECDTLIQMAKDRGLTLMVDHTFLYTGAIKKIRELIDSGELGEILYFDSVRINLGLFQHDVNVIWDLAPHDVSIMDAIIPQRATTVSAIGRAHMGTTLENVAYMTVTFEGAAIAHFHVNWLAPVKVRTMLIGGSKKMIVADDTHPSEKIKVYDKGVEVTNDVEEVHKTLVQYRTGDMCAPRLDGTEALHLVAAEFVAAIRENRPPATDAESGRRVVAVLEAANESLRNGGQPVAL
ncbi:MAG TPA: Gfo/Idh/MocA family oxidoreductase [Acidobacteriota bacterium]|nr:Gfo/Idh/MocA family oxidoreductase [Acidobacteriota bacterium]